MSISRRARRDILGEPLFAPYRLIYEDRELVVIDKPPRLPSSGLHLGDPYCLQSILCEDWGGQLWAVHQLDADTSGVNLFVKAPGLVRSVKKRMTSPNGQKTYVAICHGNPDFVERRVWAPIGAIRDVEGRDWGVTKDGKDAVSVIRVLEQVPGYALLEVDIETGRMHQIRIHLSHIQHPLVGEDWYRETSCHLHERHALHAEKMRFFDGAAPAFFFAPLREDLVGLCEKLGFSRRDWQARVAL